MWSHQTKSELETKLSELDVEAAQYESKIDDLKGKIIKTHAQKAAICELLDIQDEEQPSQAARAQTNSRPFKECIIEVLEKARKPMKSREVLEELRKMDVVVNYFWTLCLS